MRHGPAAAAHGKPKVKDFKGTMKQLLHYLSRYKFRLLLVMLFAVASTIFTIVGPKVLGNATTELFNGIMGKITGAGAGIDFAADSVFDEPAFLLWAGLDHDRHHDGSHL